MATVTLRLQRLRDEDGTTDLDEEKEGCKHAAVKDWNNSSYTEAIWTSKHTTCHCNTDGNDVHMPLDDIPKVEGREDFLLDCTVLLEEKAGTNLPALIGYLDARRLGSRIRGTWRRCGVVDNISCIQGPAQPLVIIHHPHISTAPLSRGWGVQRDV